MRLSLFLLLRTPCDLWSHSASHAIIDAAFSLTFIQFSRAKLEQITTLDQRQNGSMIPLKFSVLEVVLSALAELVRVGVHGEVVVRFLKIR